MKWPWGREQSPPEGLAPAVRALAGSIRTGTPPLRAVAEWTASEGVGRRVALGEPAGAALARLDPALARCFALHRAAGGSLPALLERAADAIESDAAAAKSALAATSGARLSARLVAGLPLAFVPLTSGGGALTSGAAGVLLLTAGLALAGTGLWWIGRLVPTASGADGAATLADDLAVALRGGIGLVPALEAAAEHPPGGIDLGRARRRVRLGEHWVDALRNEGGALASLAEVVALSREWGVPAAAPLEEWARVRRAAVRTEMQRAVRRAPVLMVVPLTLCVLPSFALLAFGPLILGAAGMRS